jgi:hypothetical protein
MRRIASMMVAAGCGGMEVEGWESGELGPVEPVYALDVSVYTRMIGWNEYECLWSEGVRHIIAGTQDPVVTAQQLDFAVASGMTVDLYVYLYWEWSVADQVRDALLLAEGRPIGRLWLDVEEDPAGRSSGELVRLVREGLEACGDFPCGIYTGAGFWRTHMNDTTVFRDVPLWYARYEPPFNLDDFEEERFGGWTSAVAKQYSGTVYVCGTGRWRLNVDENYWLRDAVPTVEVDRTFMPFAGPPPAPDGLYPAGGVALAQEYVKMMARPIDGALEYELEVVRYDGTAFRPYFRYGSLREPTRLQFSMTRNRTYRWRIRARNEHGFGAWSPFAQFDLGRVASPPPLPGADPPPPPVPPAAPPPSDVPAIVSPPDGARVTTSAVTLACTPVDRASSYAFEIEHEAGAGDYRPYYTHSASRPERTFYPLRSYPRYRWRVRAMRDGAWTAYSPYAGFEL